NVTITGVTIEGVDCTPYDKTSYDATKAKYNLRSNKQARVSADDSETFPPIDEDTDLYDDAVMSDGAVFKRIIQPDTDNHISEKQFSVKSYNPLNLLPSFNALTSPSLNIRGVFEHKIIDLINYMIDSDTHFLHICEIHKKDHKNQHTNENDFQQNNKNNTIFLTHQKFTHTPTNQIFTIIHNPDQHNKLSGNIIIISPTLYKSIGPVHAIPGRLIHYKDDNNIKSFTTDPEIIESIAIEHYKNISKITRTDKSYDPDVTLRQPWKDIYQPLTHIPTSEINKLNVPITLKELQDNI
ncbi:hypothetical protein RhiirA5_425059, partial [Rhizophagus irregularis]